MGNAPCTMDMPIHSLNIAERDDDTVLKVNSIDALEAEHSPQAGSSNQIEAMDNEGGNENDPRCLLLGKPLPGMLTFDSMLDKLRHNIIHMGKVMGVYGEGIVKGSSMNMQVQADPPLKIVSSSRERGDISTH
ncbi:hypothetical protein Nepgr_024511 [Nepenthes gracilis]|uniref:Uncharacterized protein n=1 Tax=Nepenthes gracilis TaxID=150966 RepID=A0AAD3T2Z1_NEPGR|nr:hypothetical protein Nepgr_024511 [Nepenthes gracilis]